MVCFPGVCFPGVCFPDVAAVSSIPGVRGIVSGAADRPWPSGSADVWWWRPVVMPYPGVRWSPGVRDRSRGRSIPEAEAPCEGWTPLAVFSGVELGPVTVVAGAAGTPVVRMLFFGVADSTERSRDKSFGVTALTGLADGGVTVRIVWVKCMIQRVMTKAAAAAIERTREGAADTRSDSFCAKVGQNFRRGCRGTDVLGTLMPLWIRDQSSLRTGWVRSRSRLRNSWSYLFSLRCICIR
jgi:hypothetical protein